MIDIKLRTLACLSILSRTLFLSLLINMRNLFFYYWKVENVARIVGNLNFIVKKSKVILKSFLRHGILFLVLKKQFVLKMNLK